MKYHTKAIHLYSFSKGMKQRDAPDKREGRDGVVKELHFQPLPFAPVRRGELLRLSNLKT